MRRAFVAIVALSALLLPSAPTSADVMAEFGLGILVVRGDADPDEIVVRCANGDVRVNDARPDTGRVRCANVRTILVRGGGGDDRVNLSAVRRAQFPVLLDVGVFGQAGDDVLVGSALADRIEGGAGVDTLRGAGGDDALIPDAGGGAVAGGPGGDRVVFVGGGRWLVTDARVVHRDDDERTRLSGVEWITVRGGSAADEVDAEVFSGRLLLDGGPGDDVLLGGSGRDLIRGKGGADLADGGGGHDRVEGGPGGDDLHGGPGDDQLRGGPGDDACVGGPGADSLVSC